MWLGNTFNYEAKTWSGHAGAQRMGVNLTLIKAGMRNKKSDLILLSNEGTTGPLQYLVSLFITPGALQFSRDLFDQRIWEVQTATVQL